jgi:inner membrane protein
MATIFTHGLAAYTAGKIYPSHYSSAKFLTLGVICSMLPDADVLMFHFVDYDHFLGHRGFFHSLSFCFLLALLLTAVFFRKEKLLGKKGMLIAFYLFICGASHGLLDMLTNGGLGVAIFSPFDNTRYFFPVRPIQVSPIGIERFLSHWGWGVIKTEFKWVGIPCIAVLILLRYIRKKQPGTTGE